jgi:hypothetical protein
MDRLYKDWRRFDAPPKQCHSIKKLRQECLWMNYWPGDLIAHKIKHEDALALLAELFALAEGDFRENAAIEIPVAVAASTTRLFVSETQAYREALVGCAVVRVLNQKIDIRLPATEDGDDAFSGRGLADNAVTPFLRECAVPISASPYLSALRGGAKFKKGGEPRIQRDQEGFDALVSVVDYLRMLDTSGARSYLRYLLRRFVELREAGHITLKRIAKPNLEQLRRLIEALLTVKSGGRIPSLLATAMFQTISECHGLGWEIEFQGINVADKASGAVGDITVRKGGAIILGIEVTERAISQARVTLTFNEKVSASGLIDYLFITTVKPEDGAADTARSYTSVGHEMNFVLLAPWIVHNLATIGPQCRTLFQSKIVDLIMAAGVPAEIKVAWNNKMDVAIGVIPKPAAQKE